MAFLAPPPLGSLRPSRGRKKRVAPCMCSRAWYPKSLDEIPLPVRIGLTRERSKNEKLLSAAQKTFPSAEILELPCVETVKGADRDALPPYLVESRKEQGWIVLTSPEAASVFISGWRKAHCPPLGRIAAVGKATGDAMRAVGLDVAFEPSKATGKTLVKEFPDPLTEGEPLLYPASAKASGDMPEGLTSRGFSVMRLNTYSTQLTKFSDVEKELAEGVHILTFASPSAVKGWVANAGVKEDIAVACIGETSATAAKNAGFQQVHYPERPGIEGWIFAICEAMKVYEAATTRNS